MIRRNPMNQHMMNLSGSRRMYEDKISRGLDLSNKSQWAGHARSIREGFRKKHGKSISEERLSTVMTLLENTRQWGARMDEATRVMNTGNYLDYGFELISAIVPNLVATDLVSVQALEQRHGAIFYLNYLFGSDKGNIQAGDTLNSPFTGVPGEFNYSNDVVDGEVVGTGNASNTTFNTSLTYTPVRTGTLQVFINGQLAGDVASTDGTVDTLQAQNSSGLSGTVDLASGAINLTITSAPSAGHLITVAYRYDMDQTTVGFAQVDLDLKSISIEATPRKLRTNWLLDSAYDLKQMKNIDAENELVVAMGLR